MRYIDQLSLNGKKVFVRADLNVPLTKDGGVADETRIVASVPTIAHVLEQGGAAIVCSHLGRPDGKREERYSLRPVAKRLSELLDTEVVLAPDCVGPETEKAAANLAMGKVLLLENVRFHAEEEANDADFAKRLAELADVYVNDAFGTAHRAHASTAAIVAHFEEKAGGLVMKRELDYFERALEKPARPLVAIFGGAKISSKLKALRNVAPKADRILVGGAMANTFFAAHGYNVGKSLYEPKQVEAALEAERYIRSNNCELVLPTDVLVAPELQSGVPTKAVPVSEIPQDWMALDIGPNSLETFRKAMEGAGTLVWNGPMGAFETKEFSSGTYGIIDALTQAPGLTVVGGGETDQAIHERHALDKISFVSTGGGAFLTLLEGSPLPAVDALNQ
ncbi:MAG: phosphoglycerate kinase [Bdellovibrionales bacterium]|nr:phosphoglycerate kinase [Bdellovibrionales bacterium]